VPSDATAGDARGDPAFAQLAPVVVVVVAAVGVELPRLAPWSPAPAADRGHGVDQRDELGDVVAVAAGQGHRQGMPASQIRWCVESGRPRSTGDGPTWSPL
jgi:hypothetical protein